MNILKTKCWICNKDYVDNDVKVQYHCHITGKYRGSAHRHCNINLKLNHKIPVVFHNLKNYDSQLTMEDLRKFSFINKCYTKRIRKIYELYYK